MPGTPIFSRVQLKGWGAWAGDKDAIHVCLLLLLTLVRPKLRFPTCPAYQNMTFSHISYTYLAEDRAEFHANTILVNC